MITHDKSATTYDIGTIKIGLDKMKWIVLPIGKSCRWNRLLGKVKIYYTVNSGYNKYKVVIDDIKVIIFIQNEEKYDYLLTIKKYKKIFIGKSSKKYSPYIEKFIGNSILIEISTNKYTFIGNKIYNFSTQEPIIKYESPMGNSSLAYPFAISKTFTYLMLEQKYISNDDYEKNTDPYITFYNLKKKLEHKIKSYKLLNLKFE